MLTQRGFSAAQVAGSIGLNLLPSAWKFLVGLVDVSLTSRLWYVSLIALQAMAILVVTVTPL